MLIGKPNMGRIPESHNKIKKSGATFGYNLHLRCGKVGILFDNNRYL
jgi:hypothetical protein